LGKICQVTAAAAYNSQFNYSRNRKGPAGMPAADKAMAENGRTPFSAAQGIAAEIPQ
jgi:hypothetical protein